MLIAAAVGALLGGEAEAQQSPVVAAILAADAHCKALIYETKAPYAECFNSGERAVWASMAPAYLPLFEPMASRRYAIFANIDSGAISVADGDVQMRAAAVEFWDQVATQSDAALRQQRAAEAARQDMLARQILLGISLYAHARANADAAGAAALAASPKITHTYCQTVAGQLQCTNTPY